MARPLRPCPLFYEISTVRLNAVDENPSFYHSKIWMAVSEIMAKTARSCGNVARPGWPRLVGRGMLFGLSHSVLGRVHEFLTYDRVECW